MRLSQKNILHNFNLIWIAINPVRFPGFERSIGNLNIYPVWFLSIWLYFKTVLTYFVLGRKLQKKSVFKQQVSTDLISRWHRSQKLESVFLVFPANSSTSSCYFQNCYFSFSAPTADTIWLHLKEWQSTDTSSSSMGTICCLNPSSPRTAFGRNHFPAIIQHQNITMREGGNAWIGQPPASYRPACITTTVLLNTTVLNTASYYNSFPLW